MADHITYLTSAYKGEMPGVRTVSPLLRYAEGERRLLMTHSDADILYAFSDIRSNILDWYEFREDTSLLEVSAGCGGLTGLFLSRIPRVTSLCPSEAEAAVLNERYASHEGHKVFCGSLKDLPLSCRFDYISVVGLGELMRDERLTGNEESAAELIAELKKHLHPGGRILLAADNKYAMKYFAGMPSELTGRYDAGPFAFGHADRTSFTMQDLKAKTRQAGLETESVYYPMPDYYYPEELYSDDHLPKPGSISNDVYNYRNKRYAFYDENRAYDSVCEDGRFPEYASAFLLILK